MDAFPEYNVTPVRIDGQVQLKSLVSMAGKDIIAVGNSQNANRVMQVKIYWISKTGKWIKSRTKSCYFFYKQASNWIQILQEGTNLSLSFSLRCLNNIFFFTANSTGSPVQLPYSEARQRQGSQYVVCQWETDPQNKGRNWGQELQCKYLSNTICTMNSTWSIQCTRITLNYSQYFIGCPYTITRAWIALTSI